MSVSLVSSSLAFSLPLLSFLSLTPSRFVARPERPRRCCTRRERERDLRRKRERERERRAKSESQMAEQATNTLRNENATCFRLWKKKSFLWRSSSSAKRPWPRTQASPNESESSRLFFPLLNRASPRERKKKTEEKRQGAEGFASFPAAKKKPARAQPSRPLLLLRFSPSALSLCACSLLSFRPSDLLCPCEGPRPSPSFSRLARSRPRRHHINDGDL